MREFDEERQTTNRSVYKKVHRRHLICKICEPNHGCNGNKKQESRNKKRWTREKPQE